MVNVLVRYALPTLFLFTISVSSVFAIPIYDHDRGYAYGMYDRFDQTDQAESIKQKLTAGIGKIHVRPLKAFVASNEKAPGMRGASPWVDGQNLGFSRFGHKGWGQRAFSGQEGKLRLVSKRGNVFDFDLKKVREYVHVRVLADETIDKVVADADQGEIVRKLDRGPLHIVESPKVSFVRPVDRVCESWPDETDVSPVPEPGTLVLVGIGGLLLAIARRRH